MSSEKLIKDALKAGKTVIGKESVMKAVKTGKVTTVMCPVNCPAGLLKEFEYYGKVSGLKLEKFEGNSADLGQLCGKPFNIVILGIEK